MHLDFRIKEISPRFAHGMKWHRTVILIYSDKVSLTSFSLHIHDLCNWQRLLVMSTSGSLLSRVGCSYNFCFGLLFVFYWVKTISLTYLLTPGHGNEPGGRSIPWWKQMSSLLPPVSGLYGRGWCMHATSIACTLRRPKFSIAKCCICNYTLIIWLMHLNITK